MQGVVVASEVMPQFAFAQKRSVRAAAISEFEPQVLTFVVVQTAIHIAIRTSYALDVEGGPARVTQSVHASGRFRNGFVDAVL